MGDGEKLAHIGTAVMALSKDKDGYCDDINHVVTTIFG